MVGSLLADTPVNPNGKTGLLTLKVGRTCHDGCDLVMSRLDRMMSYIKIELPIHNYVTLSYGRILSISNHELGVVGATGAFDGMFGLDSDDEWIEASYELQIHLPLYKIWEKN